tara:strand:- start:583 stop:1470 length:888 start_codon:yes stop_codon:yes gene_type:complete
MKIEQMIGIDDPTHAVGHVKRILEESEEIPDLLFVGPPGLGKTTLAHAIADYVNAELHEFNASDERGIDMVRTRIKELSTQRGWGENRIILLDEADGLTKQAQDALRRIIETGQAWFILTANVESNLIPALRSRCNTITFTPYNEEHIQQFIGMLDPSYDVDEETACRIQTATGGDLRRVRNLIMSSSVREDLDRAIGNEMNTISQAALSLIGGAWEDLRLEMQKLSWEGHDRFTILRRLHDIVREMVPDAMTADDFYAYSSVWGDAVLSAHLWPLGDSGFIDWFVGKVAVTARD